MLERCHQFVAADCLCFCFVCVKINLTAVDAKQETSRIKVDEASGGNMFLIAVACACKTLLLSF